MYKNNSVQAVNLKYSEKRLSNKDFILMSPYYPSEHGLRTRTVGHL